jgi:uncharacterized membrane protein AbrB (regulator of aidB expression)
MLKLFSHFCIIVLLLKQMCIGCRFKSSNFGSSSKGNKLMFLIVMFFAGFWVCSSVGWVLKKKQKKSENSSRFQVSFHLEYLQISQG